ncbi:MAG: hypothetical protein HYR85_24875 [Planctomycetes bacterium]|nr:hypothetical protein [Planctomycetota bacterium]MBI3846083.1 hypothetical protein [Planctomycetota bacterium]
MTKRWLTAALLCLASCGGGGGGGGGGSNGGGGGPAPASFVGIWSGTYQDAATTKKHGFRLTITDESAPDATGAQMLAGMMAPLGLDGLTTVIVAGTRRGARVDLASAPGQWNLTFAFVAQTALANGSFSFQQNFGPRQLLGGGLQAQYLTGNERLAGTWEGTWRSSFRPPLQGTIEWLVTAQTPNPQGGGSVPDLLAGRIRLVGFPEIGSSVFGLETSGDVNLDAVSDVNASFPAYVFHFDGQAHLGFFEGEYELRHVASNTVVDRGTLRADLRP